MNNKINYGHTATVYPRTVEEEKLFQERYNEEFRKITTEHMNQTKEQLKATQFETLYLSLKNTVDYIDKEVVGIYNIIDRLSGIPLSDKIRQEVPYNESQKIIPAFQEEVLKLEEIKDVLSIIKHHLEQVI